MTNENLAAISAIKTFKIEKEIYKTVIKKLIDKEADENLVVLLIKPELISSIIDEHKYTEALDYVLHTYQQERAHIVREMRLKAFSKPVQGPINEARFSSIPTSEVVNANNIEDENLIKTAKDAASTFMEEPKPDLSLNIPNQTNQTLKAGANEISGSLEENEKELLKEATENIEKKNKDAEVEIPKINVLPEEKKEKVEVKKDDSLLDEELHEVKKQRPVTAFFRKHKKAVLIASGLAVISVTSLVMPTLIIPSLMSANSTLASHAGAGALTNILHGLNTVLAKVAGATFAPETGIWTGVNGALINAEAAKASMGVALGTYGLWGVYGKGFVKTIKNMFGALDMEDKPKEEKEEPKKETIFNKASEKLTNLIQAANSPEKKEREEKDYMNVFQNMSEAEFNEMVRKRREALKNEELSSGPKMGGR